VFVADRNGIIQYVQLVKEITQEPDYGAVLTAVSKLV
jgi:thiol peroxidase